jgi:DeoR/GlpR family transcriptional regulator of sugar metabolism
MRGEELPFAMRAIEATGSKRRIAAAVAELIADGEAVGLDSGTTVAETARALAGRRLTVMPLSLHAAMALAGSASVRLMLPGGEARPGELAMVGPLALAGIAALRQAALAVVCELAAVDVVVTDDSAPAPAVAALQAAGVEVHCV